MNKEHTCFHFAFKHVETVRVEQKIVVIFKQRIARSSGSLSPLTALPALSPTHSSSLRGVCHFTVQLSREPKKKLKESTFSKVILYLFKTGIFIKKNNVGSKG